MADFGNDEGTMMNVPAGDMMQSAGTVKIVRGM